MKTNAGTKQHYEALLAEIYSWMSGDFDTRVNQTKEFFIKYNIVPQTENRTAVDLGSGHGIQSAAMAALGFNVTAVDFNEQLLNELKQNCPEITNIINADLTDYNFENITPPELVIYMGDTLTHLAEIPDAKKLFGNIYNNLQPGGKLVLSFRDYSNELEDTKRFINVKSDESKILTCFLEYFDEYVKVTDILHYKINGKFEMKAGAYRKLRLPEDILIKELEIAGFKIKVKEQISGMLHIISEKTK